MKEGLLQLLKLQEHDKKLEALDKSKSQFPTEIEERKIEVTTAGEVLVEMEEEKTTWEKKQRHSEGEIQLAKENLKVHEDRFSVVTNNKEYDALQIEIQACKDTISEHENQLLQAMESTQRIEQELEVEQKNLRGNKTKSTRKY
jgi:predicted  nucleic acid-binding Zn-ribbon protein